MNVNKLEQNHPCVIDTIRRHYLHKPSPNDVPYNLEEPEVGNLFYTPDQSEDNSEAATYILNLLKNKVFFKT